MSKDNNVDMDRYFNDPEYRKEIANTKKKRPLIPPKYKNIALGTAIALLIAIVGFVIYLFQGLPSIEELENPRTAIASEVRSRDGAVLDRYLDRESVVEGNSLDIGGDRTLRIRE